MMKLEYRTATLSLCSDLTSPSATSMPIATLLIGEYGELRMATAAMCSVRIPGADPVTREIAENLPRVLEHIVLELARTTPTATVDELIEHVHGALRNTLHVSDVEGRSFLVVEDVDEAVTAATTTVLQALREALVEHLGERVAPRTPRLPRLYMFQIDPTPVFEESALHA